MTRTSWSGRGDGGRHYFRRTLIRPSSSRLPSGSTSRRTPATSCCRPASTRHRTALPVGRSGHAHLGAAGVARGSPPPRVVVPSAEPSRLFRRRLHRRLVQRHPHLGRRACAAGSSSPEMATRTAPPGCTPPPPRQSRPRSGTAACSSTATTPRSGPPRLTTPRLHHVPGVGDPRPRTATSPAGRPGGPRVPGGCHPHDATHVPPVLDRGPGRPVAGSHRRARRTGRRRARPLRRLPYTTAPASPSRSGSCTATPSTRSSRRPGSRCSHPRRARGKTRTLEVLRPRSSPNRCTPST